MIPKLSAALLLAFSVKASGFCVRRKFSKPKFCTQLINGDARQGFSPPVRLPTNLAGLNNEPEIESQTTEKALIGMGCFWAPQEEFSKVPGILKATSGYAVMSTSDDENLASNSPNIPAASYFSICNGDGRTEAILLEFDPAVISYQTILRRFWQSHNAAAQQPSPEKQIQYASAIWPLSEEQLKVAQNDFETVKQVYKENNLGTPKTVISKNILKQGNQIITMFTPAENIHQNFWTKLQAKVGLIMIVSILSSYGFVDQNIASYGLYPIFLWVFWESVELGASALGSLGIVRPTPSQEKQVISSSNQ